MSLGLTVILAAALARGAPSETRFELSGRHMGTMARLVIYAGNRVQAEAAARAAFARIAEIEVRLSDDREDGELSALGRTAGGPAVMVSHDLFVVLSRAQDLARRSDGAFDVTGGPLSRLWRAAVRAGTRPDPAELVAARALVGHTHLELLPGARQVRLDRPGMRLDLGGIARGYAADEALGVLRKKRFPRSLVELGGDVVVGTAPPGLAGWTVAIPTPGPTVAPLVLSESAVSTSGLAEPWPEIGGQPDSPLYDPRTGEALAGRRSVTVVARDGMDADALASALRVLGPDAGLALVDSVPGAAALFVEEKPGGWRTLSRGFDGLPRAGLTAPPD
jgi:thiamine biosynthesis lipoprotein